jgi:molybdate transport system substrate-binding protein
VEIVIAVPKGSEKVQSLKDLVKPGVRVAVGEPTQCTIGALTRRLLQAEELWKRLKEKQQRDGEVVVEKSSSALLIPDVLTGHVDAAVAYISDTLASRDQIDIVRIESEHNRAIQPLSIAKSSEHKHLGRRLFRRIAESREAFETAGFHFRLAPPPDDPGVGKQ